MPNEKLDAREVLGASMIGAGDANEAARAEGYFTVECFDADGNLIWREVFDNVVCTVGKNLALDAYLGPSAYTLVGPFVGLIGTSGGTFTAVSAADTMASHSGWFESTAGVSSARKSPTFGAASAGAKATSTPMTFPITGTDTLKGAFLVYGTGAVATVASTAGILYSAGQFAADQPVINTNTVNVTYSTSL